VPADGEQRWTAAFKLDHQDKVSEAFALLRGAGLDQWGQYLKVYRMIEAEAITRGRARIEEASPWLTLEYIPYEVGDAAAAMRRMIGEACDTVARRLGVVHQHPARIAVMAEECDVPWATNPYGYCADKEPYAKVCVPVRLLDDPPEFMQTIAHEYAHVVSLSLSQGRAPRWLEEAVSVLAERSFDQGCWEDFVEDRVDWLPPGALELEFGFVRYPDQADSGWNDPMLLPEGPPVTPSDDAGAMYLAYQQAGFIGRYLLGLADESRVGRLLREIGSQSLWRGLSVALRFRSRTDDALRRVYGLGEQELFDRTLDWLRRTPWEQIARTGAA
jgi:hypothetical protein